MTVDSYRIKDVKGSQNIIEEIDKLALSVESTKEARCAYGKLKKYYKVINSHLPFELKNKLTNDIDVAIMELLVLFEEHFFKYGYINGNKRNQKAQENKLIYFASKYRKV